MKENWKYPDLIDLEYYLALDRSIDQAELHKRDREIYLAAPAEIQDGGQNSQIHHWLIQRRSRLTPGENKQSPGRTLFESVRSINFLLLFFGLLIGLLTGLSFFSYSGTTPVNVFYFLFLFIFSQLLMICFIFIGSGLRIAGFNGLPAPVIHIYARVTAWLIKHLAHFTESLSAEKRLNYTQIIGSIKKYRARYGSVFYWPLFRLSQTTMVGFNLGLLAATLFRLITSDIAFGWQSTIQFSSEFLYKIIWTLALPWSWLVPQQYAYPSLTEIEGSRIILKDGIYHLATQDLVSWWPFLVFCILVYGLLLRLVLVFFSRFGERRSMHNLKLNSPEILLVVQRLRSPLLSSQANPEDNPDATHSKFKPADPQAIAANLSIPHFPLLLLIPVDVMQITKPESFYTHLSTMGMSITAHKTFMQDYDSDQRMLKELEACDWQTDSGILAVMEAWMVPIQDTLDFLKKLRSAVDEHTPIFIGLIGQHSEQLVITKPSDVDLRIWHQKIDSLGDPFLSFIDMYEPH